MLKNRIEKLEYNITPRSKQKQSIYAKIMAKIIKESPPIPTIHIYNPKLPRNTNIYLSIMGQYRGEQPTDEERQRYKYALTHDTIN